jgi:hypothetical protein
VNFRYVVALLLIRRRRFRLEAEQPQLGTMTIRCAKTGETFNLTNPQLSEEEMNQVQDEVFEVLGWH